ncbi:MAG: hypothetical protein ABIS50_15280 [Luteolibacter sp.]|uniref:hypothetical protein n=1 Tax=Luteolibacter sp. TaxID=1962973 RepID=UPI003263BC51
MTEEQKIARAILGTSRKVLTRREIEICEDIIEDEGFLLEPYGWTGSDNETFASLQIQFSREIGQWLDRTFRRKSKPRQFQLHVVR